MGAMYFRINSILEIEIAYIRPADEVVRCVRHVFENGVLDDFIRKV
jgi:hypothetical protein